MAISEMGYGLGVGIVAFSLAMRAVYSPFILYSQVASLKMQMLSPEFNAHRQSINKLYRTGNTTMLAKVNEDFTQLKRRHGIRGGLQAVPLTQLPAIIYFFWTLQEMAYGVEDFPQIATDGFLWFKDLSQPDPYYILPVALAVSTFTSIHKNPTTSQMTGPVAKYAKYLKYFTFFALPITSTFPSAIVLNWFIMSFFQLGINSLVYTKTGRKLLRIPTYLPGSLLEKLNTKKTVDVVKPKVYTHNPLKKKPK